ncbi:MAG: SUF system NifU family Fe-S cluster assembly protein [Gemmatimonadaceae bacterium]
MDLDLSPNIQAMFQELILDHYRRPRNKGELEGEHKTIAMKNPLCGDEVYLHLALEDERVSDISFTGRGCSISQAAASMITQAVKGKTAGEAETLGERYREMIMGDAEAAKDKSLGQLRALSGVSKFPARVKCALLAWNALEEGLK